MSDIINKDSKINTHYYIDNDRCLAENCFGFVYVVNDSSTFFSSVPSAIYLHKYDKTESRYILLAEINIYAAGKIEDITGAIDNSFRDLTGRSPKNIIYVVPITEYGKVYADGFVIYSIFPYKIEIADTGGSTLFSEVRYMCNFISKRYGFCKDMDGSQYVRGNVICKDDFQDHPSSINYCMMKYPIILQNCKICNDCYNMCAHAGAIKNSITNSRKRIEDVCHSDYKIMFTNTLYSNQQSKEGAYVFK